MPQRRISPCLVLGMLTWQMLHPDPAAARIVVIAESGQRSPDDSGDLSELENAVTQTAGEAYFSATIRENGVVQSHDLFRAGPQAGQLALVAEEGAPSPDGNGNLETFGGDIPFVNDRGGVAFGHVLENTLGGLIDSRVVLSVPVRGTALGIVARSNQVIPNTGGDRFDILLEPQGFNNAGQVAFLSVTQISEQIGIWRGDGNPASIVRIVGVGDPTPQGDGLMTDSAFTPGRSLLNEAGAVAFYDLIQLTAGGVRHGIFRATRFDAIVEIAREGRTIPSGPGTFASFTVLGQRQLGINDSGQVAFGAVLQGTAGGTTDNFGLFRGDGTTTVQLMRKGTPVPGGNGSFVDTAQAPASQLLLNNRGDVFFRANITGATGGSNNGLFLAGPTGQRLVARLNAPAPGGGTFESFSTLMALNNSSQAVFYALVDIGPTSVAGLFLYEAGTLRAIVREGDTIPGYGVVTNLITSTGLEGENAPGRTLLNDLGEVVFTFFYTGGGAAIGRWTTDSQLFVDGFETGNTSAWSSTVD
jgi:hypothetical protein